MQRLANTSSTMPAAGDDGTATEGGTINALKRCVAPARPNSVDWRANSELTIREARAAILCIESIQTTSSSKHRAAHPRLKFACGNASVFGQTRRMSNNG